MRHDFDVTLRGTWSREDTSEGELRHFRRRVIAAAEKESIELKIKAKRGPYGERHGTFVAKVPIRAARSTRYTSRRARALRILRDLLSDLVCRPPTLRVVESYSFRGGPK